MVEGAKLGFVTGARGIVPDAVTTWFLPQVVGLPTALDWCAVCTPPANCSTQLTASPGRSPRTSPPVFAALTRRILWRIAGMDHPMHAHRFDSAAIAAMGRLADAAEGVEPFLQKRRPEWRLSPRRDLPAGLPWPEEPEFDLPG